MNFAVDRIENDIVILENLVSKIKIEVSTKELPDGISDGTILKFENGKYLYVPSPQLQHHLASY